MSGGGTGPVRTMVVVAEDWPLVAAGVDRADPAAVLVANRVVATTPAARAAGVHVGLRRREAQARCPDVAVLAADPARDARAFEAVVAAVEAVTPRIEVTEPGTCSLPTRGPSRYFGGDEALAGRVRALVAAVTPTVVRVGVADGPFAALRAARRGPEGVVVPPGGSRAFLAPAPVRALDDGSPAAAALVDVLARLGVTTLGDLAALPRADLVARFGWPGERAHRLAAGEDPRLPDTRPPPPDLTVAVELDPPAERVELAAFAAKRLADDLHRRLTDRGLACTRVVVTAETEHGERRERVWRHEGALTVAAMAERVRWQLEGWLGGSAATRPTSGVTRLVLAPDEVGAARGRQLGFWGGETAGAERATRALARVDGLLGSGASTVPERRGGRHPDEAVTLVAAEAVDLAQRTVAPDEGPEAAPWPGRLPRPMPAMVLTHRRRVGVVDRQGRAVAVNGRGLASAAPARVDLGDGDQEVVGWAGPWPVDERWWDADAHRRRARLQVLTAAGTAHLLALESGSWWLEATYD